MADNENDIPNTQGTVRFGKSLIWAAGREAILIALLLYGLLSLQRQHEQVAERLGEMTQSLESVFVAEMCARADPGVCPGYVKQKLESILKERAAEVVDKLEKKKP